jgi:predicted dehydrogenase
MHPAPSPAASAGTSRRRFLLQSAAVLGFPTIIPATALGRAGRPAPSERITVAVVGWGTIATHWTPSFLNNEKCQVVAVADPMKESGSYGYSGELCGGREAGRQFIDKFYSENSKTPVKNCAAFADFRELLEKQDVDAVQICTPDHWHAYQTVYCARKGKHLYGQKPLSLNIGDGRLMVDAVNEAGITWQTGSQQRSDLYFRTVAELVRNGRIGKVKRIRIGLPGGHKDWSKLGAQKEAAPVPADFDYDMWLGPAEAMEYRPALLPLNWRHNFNFSGGMITDFGAHHIDIAQWAMDLESTGPVSLSNVKGELPPADALYNTATKFHYECNFDNGVQYVISDADAKSMPELEAAQKDGKPADHTGIFFEGEDGKWIWVNRGKRLASDPNIFREKIGPEEVHFYESKDHTDNFLDCVYSGKPPVAPVEAAHRTITISHLGNIALRLGKTSLEWDPKTETFPGDDGSAARLKSREWRKPWVLA